MFSTSELQSLLHITSAARLSSYKQCLGTKSAEETYGAYMWSKAVSAAFTPLIQAIEISLRNALHNTLTPAYGQNWFEKWAIIAGDELRKSSKLSGKSEGEKLIAKAQKRLQDKARQEHQRRHPGMTHTAPPISWQAVLAEMTFGFWVNFLNKRFWDINHRKKLWPNHLSGAFPGAPSHMYAQGALHKEFQAVLEIRNRIHHQEPLWKHHSVNTADKAIAFLQQQLAECCQRLAYLSPESLLALERYGAIAAIEEICSKISFSRFIGASEGIIRPLRTARKDLRLLARNIGEDQSLWIVSPSKRPLLVIRHANRRFF